MLVTLIDSRSHEIFLTNWPYLHFYECPFMIVEDYHDSIKLLNHITRRAMTLYYSNQRKYLYLTVLHNWKLKTQPILCMLW